MYSIYNISDLDVSASLTPFCLISFQPLRFVAFSVETILLLPPVSFATFCGLAFIHQSEFNIVLQGFSCVNGDVYTCWT